MSRRVILILAGVLAAYPAPCWSENAIPSAEDIIAKVEAADRARRESMPGYTSVRHYLVENDRFHVKASMKVEVTVDSSGVKSFRTLDVSGPAAVRKLVFSRMLDTEAKASVLDVQPSTRVSRDNYTFRFIEAVGAGAGLHYVLDAEPKTDNPMLLRGRIWVDAGSFAIARIEGAPAQNPSFWVRKTRFIHEYAARGGQWLGVINRSESDIRIFGHSVVTIRYGDCVFTPTGGDRSTSGSTR